MNIFKLVGSVFVDTDKANQSLQKTDSKAGGLANKLGKGLGTAAKVGATAIGATAAAGAAAVGSIVKLSNSTAEYGDNIDKASQKLGISAEGYQKWDAVLQHSGTSIDQVSVGFKTLAKGIQDGSKSQVEAFQKLGLSQEELANMSTEDAFQAVIGKLQGMEEGTERTALATTLLGKAGMNLGALLNTSAKDTKDMMDRVEELGGVMSNKAVKDSARFEDSLQDMQTGIDGVKRKIGAEFLPTLSDMMDGVSDIFAGDEEQGISKLTDGIENFINKIGELLPKVANIAMPILTSLADGIIQNLPMLMQVGTDILTSLVSYAAEALPQVVSMLPGILMTLIQAVIDSLPSILQSLVVLLQSVAQMLIDNLPVLLPFIIDSIVDVVDMILDNLDLFIEASIQIVLALAQGLIQALPRLIEKIPVIIQKTIQALNKCFPLIVNAGIQLIAMLASGIVQAIPSLVKAVPQIMSSLVSGFKVHMGSILTIGKNIVDGLWTGFRSAFDRFLQNVKGLIGKLPKTVKKLLGINSPSKVFAELGGYSAEGFGVGFDDSWKNITKGLQTDVNATVNGLEVKGSMIGGGSDIYGLLEQYLPELANMQVVLNSGQLVGATSGKIDRALGNINNYSLRGVAI